MRKVIATVLTVAALPVWMMGPSPRLGEVTEASAVSVMAVLDRDWTRSLSNTNTSNNLEVNDAAVDKDGNIYVVGMSNGSYDINPSPSSTTNVSVDRKAIVAKFDSSGDYIWHMTVGAANSNWQSIDFEPSGERFWVAGNICGGNGSQSFNFSRTGAAVTVSNFPIGTCQAMVVKYDMDGVVVAQSSTSAPIVMRISAGMNESNASDLVATANSVYVTGFFYSSNSSAADFNPLGTANPVTGARNTVSGGRDAYLAKYSVNGELAWVKSFGSSSSTGYDRGWHVDVDGAGNVYNHGIFSTATNYDLGGGAISFATQRHYLVKFTSAGTHEWSFRFSGDDTGSYDRVNDMKVSGSGDVFIAGHQSGTFDFRGKSSTAKNIVAPTNAYGGYLVSFNTSGEYRWHVVPALKTHPSGTSQNLSEFESLAVASDGSVLATGHMRGTMDFDPSAAEYLLAPSTASCVRDRFVATFSSSGGLEWAERPESTCATGTPTDTNLGGNIGHASISLGSSFVTVFRAYSPVPTFMIKYGPDTAAPTTPGVPNLATASDSGASSSDDLTNDTTPTITVIAAEDGGTVTVTAQKQGQPDASCSMTGATGAGSTCTISSALAEGEWSLTATHEDAAGNVSGSSAALSIDIDTTAPALLSTSPTRDATGVLLDSNITLTYDEAMTKGSGNLLIRRGSSGCATTSETLSVTSAAVTVAGAVVTINPTANFIGSTEHCLSFSSGVLRDLAGNNAAAHDPSASGGVRFTTEAGDTTPPSVTIGAPTSPTSSRTLTYSLSFSESITGLAAGDFEETGTANCTVATPSASSGTSMTVDVTCASDGTVILRLKAGTVADGASNTGPTSAVSASTVTISTPSSSTTSPTTSSTIAPQSGVTTTTVVTAGSPTTTVAPSSPGATVAPSAPSGTAAPSGGSTPTTTATSGDSAGAPTQVASVATTTTTTPAVTTTTLPPLDVPSVSTGGGALTIGGQRVEATITRENNQLILEAGPIVARISAIKREGGRAPLDADGRIRMMTGDSVEVEVSGFGPSTEVEVRLYSEPTLLGRTGVSADGALLASYEIPDGVSDGDHTVVLAGESADAEELVFALSVAIGEPGDGAPWFTIFVLVPLGLAAVGALIIPAVLRRRREEQPA